MKQKTPPPRSTSHFTKKRSVKAGLPPGSLVHIGDLPPEAASISFMQYDAEQFEELQFGSVEACLDHLQQHVTGQVVWVNVEGVHNVELIRNLGEYLGLHPLVLEDLVNTIQRPKIEDYGSYLFMVLRMLKTAEQGHFSSEQLAVIITSRAVFTFQEALNGDVFDAIRSRIRAAKGRIRSMGADYLAYSLIDAVVDGYFGVLENTGEEILAIEDRLALEPDRSILQNINGIKKEIIYLRKAVWPLREALSFLERGDSELIQEGTRLFFRDVYDHTIQVIDTVETYRDLLSGMLDLYLSSISNRTNEIMKFLTLVGTIFMPLTFLVGVYGMNFKHLPELEWYYGYPILWAFMILLSVAMVIYFKRKRWL